MILPKIDFPEKMRLKFNIYSYRMAYKRLESAIEQENNNEVYASVGELLLWVLTTEEWHFEHNDQYKKYKNSNENGLIIYGLRHAYNMVKHNMQFFEIYQKHNGSEFNSLVFNEGVFNSSTEYRWINGINVIDQDESRGKQYENYVTYLQDKEIEDTFKDAITFFNKINEPFLFAE